MSEFVNSPDFLQTIVVEANKNNDDAKRVTTNLTEAQMNWKPSQDQWSIAQCLDHLTVSGAEFEPLFSEAISRGLRKWPTDGPIPYRPSMLGGWLIKQVAPEAVRKLKAPKILKPSDSTSIHGTLEKFLQQEESFLAFVKEATGLDYNKTRLRSPVTPLIRYSLADAFVITVVHDRRHLIQARRVLEAPDFPRTKN